MSAASRGRGDYGLMLLAAVMCSAVFWVPWAAGKFPFHGIRGEMLMQWIPYRVFMSECYKEGQFPLWVPYIFGGMPFWGYSHTMSAYPGMIASLALPLLHGTCIFFVFHTVVAVAGTYRLLERLGFGRALCFAGTVLMVSAGFGLSIGAREFYINIAAWSWLPLMVLALIELTETASLASLLAAAAVLLMEMLTGDIEAISYNVLTCALMLILVRPGGRALLARGKWALLIVAFVIAFLAAALMWAPLLEYMPHNVRGGGVTMRLFREDLLSNTPLARSPLIALAAMFLPGSASSWFIIFFAGYHLLAKRSRSSWLLAGAALLCLVYFFRLLPVMDEVLIRLPVVSSFLKRGQIIGGATFLLHYLAVAGMRDFLEKDNDWRRWARWMSSVGILGAGVFLALIVVTRQSRVEGALAFAAYLTAAVMAWTSLHPRRTAPAAAIVLATILLAAWGPFIAGAEFQDPDYFRSRRFSQAAAKMDPDFRHLNAAIINAAGSNDLYPEQGMVHGLPEVFGWNRVPPKRYLDVIALIDPSLVKYKNGKLDGWDFVFEHANGSLLRGESTALLEFLGVRYFLDQNIPTRNISPSYLAWGLSPAERNLRFVPEDWRDLYVTSRPLETLAAIGGTGRLAFGLGWSPGSPAGVTGPARVAVKVGGMEVSKEVPVKVSPDSAGASAEVWVNLDDFRRRKIGVIIAVEFDGPRPAGLRLTRPRIEDAAAPFQLTQSNNAFDVYVDTQSLPTAFVVHRSKVFPDGRDLLDYMGKASRDDLAGEVLLTYQWAGFGTIRDLITPPTPDDSVAVTKRTPSRVEYQVSSSTTGALVVTHNRLPGWRVRVDGMEMPLVEADWAFGAVPIQGGVSRVELWYQPVGFRIGLWVFISTVLISAAILLFSKNMIK